MDLGLEWEKIPAGTARVEKTPGREGGGEGKGGEFGGRRIIKKKKKEE